MLQLLSDYTKRRMLYAIAIQKRELRSDWIFFGAVGAILGLSENLIVRAQEKGLNVSLSAVDDLLSDFMSVKATILILILVALACSGRNLVVLKQGKAERLSKIAAHSAMRLRQLASSITCFSGGFAAGLAFTVLGSFDVKALLLAVMVFAIGSSVTFFAILGTALQRNIGECREAWVSIVIVIGCVCYLVFIIVCGFA